MHGILWCSIVKVDPCGASNAKCTVYGELYTYLLYVCGECCLCVCSSMVMLEYTVYSDGHVVLG